MDHTYSVSEFVALTNQLLESAFPFVRIEGEVSNFKVSQNKWVTFKLSDNDSIVECFMTVWSMRTPLEDGMKVIVAGNPALKGKWGKFSVTVQRAVPTGEGALRRAFEMLRKKLDEEGLFNPARKRTIPEYPMHIGVVSSEQADGYKDFITIAEQRWPLAKISFAHSLVQGEQAPDNLIKSLTVLNELPETPEVIAIVRGGGSAEDLSAFNDERLVRAIAGSRVPVVTGVGHENDVTLSDLVSDIRAATPSNAAELICPDVAAVTYTLETMAVRYKNVVQDARSKLAEIEQDLAASIEGTLSRAKHMTAMYQRIMREVNPDRILQRGYAIVRIGDSVVSHVRKLKSASTVKIQLKDGTIKLHTKEQNT